MRSDKKITVDRLLGRMTLVEKIGQCFVIGCVGTVATPEILRRIKEYRPAGIRAGLVWRVRTARHDPGGTNLEYERRVVRPFTGTQKDLLPGLPVPYCTNREYCRFLNGLREASSAGEWPVPLHFTFDMEGDMSADYYRGGIRYFPSCMGLASTGDPLLAYNAAWAVGRQVQPLGYDWAHSPVLDVNTNPLNPEIGTRSYGGTPETVIEYGREALSGFRHAGIIATGKHFPGRGASASDAHRSLPVVDLPHDQMEIHLAPYRTLIAEGLLPAIMTAHSAYPALDPAGFPATLSRRIITELLKEEMGFAGAVTTDEITMGGIVERYDVPEACIRALDAGADLILIRDESSLLDEAIPAVKQAVEQGRVNMARIDDAVRRTLSVKYDYGFFNMDKRREPDQADLGISDPMVASIAAEAAHRCLRILRDEDGLLPVSPSTRVLLVEQVNILHERTNTQECHPGLLWEKMLQYSDRVGIVETRMSFPGEDRERVRERAPEADLLVVTNYFDRRQDKGNDFVREVHAWGKPVIVVTNSPYPFTALPEYRTVILTYGSSPESMAETAGCIYGFNRS